MALDFIEEILHPPIAGFMAAQFTVPGKPMRRKPQGVTVIDIWRRDGPAIMRAGQNNRRFAFVYNADDIGFYGHEYFWFTPYVM